MNAATIEKIIKELSMRDYKARCLNLTKAQKRKISLKEKTLSDYGGYTLSSEAMEAIKIKRQYLDGRISEEEYKTWCLNYNLRTTREGK